MAYLQSNVPYFKCWVRKEYTHNHEKYHGEAGFKAHQAAPHFADWEMFAGTDPFTAPPEVFVYRARQ